LQAQERVKGRAPAAVLAWEQVMAVLHCPKEDSSST
jgi:hypothetical protein